MVKYLIFDFETTGFAKDAQRGFKLYDVSQRPLPRENFPVELSYVVVDEQGVVLESVDSIIIRGAKRLNPFVQENCPHLSIEKCDRDGVDFSEALRRLARAADGCTLVAHNLQYDWDQVIVATAEPDSVDFQKLKACPRFCTCVNPLTKANKTAYFFKKIGRWIGPKLQDLAATHGVEYDAKRAHKASYDVVITLECLRKIKQLGPKKRTVETLDGNSCKKQKT